MTTSIPVTRRAMLASSAAATALLALSACAPDSGGNVGPSSSGPLADDGAKEFAFVSWSMNEEASKAQLQQLITGYQSKAGVTVSTPAYPYNDFLKQIILQLRGGQATGAIQMDIAWLTSTASLGKYADLSSFAEGAGYADYALKSGQYQGKQVGLPWTTGAIGMVGNSELLDKVGMTSPPETIEDFEALLRELKGVGGGVVPYAAMTKVANLKDIVPWMWTFGSPVYEGDQFVLGDEGSVACLTWYKKMYDEGLIGKDLDRFDARALFGQGKVGIYEDAPAARKFVTANATDATIGDKLTAFGRPVLEKGSPAQALQWGQVICVTQSKGGHAAAQFAKYMTSDPEVTLSYFASAGYPPTTTKALEDPKFTSDAFAKEFATRITPTSTADPLWQFPASAQMYEAIANEVQAVLIGKKQPKQAADDANAALKQLKG